MTTPRIRSLVSLAAALIVTLMIGGCASAPSRLATDVPAATVRFDNEARDYVHVYLVGARQEWLLGRVAPGARARLQIPTAALAEDAGMMWFAVLPGDRVTMRAAGEARAATTIGQPMTALLSQRWTFSQLTTTGQITSLSLGSPRPVVANP
jgi:hypothetical protein